MFQLLTLVPLFTLFAILAGLALLLFSFAQERRAYPSLRFRGFGFAALSVGFLGISFYQEVWNGAFPLDRSPLYVVGYATLSMILLFAAWRTLQSKPLQLGVKRFSLATLMLLTLVIVSQVAIHTIGQRLGEAHQSGFREPYIPLIEETE